VVEKDDKPAIRFGLTSIKNFGEGIAGAVLAERSTHGAYTSLADVLTRIKDKNLNKKSLEALIKCGALDGFGFSRGRMLTHIDALLSFSREMTRDTMQSSLFGGGTASLSLPEAPDAPLETMLAWEKELLGLYVSGHPLDAHRDKLRAYGKTIRDIKDGYLGVETIVAGLLTEVKPFTTKKGDKMAFLTLTDYEGKLEAVVFPKTYEAQRDLFVPETCVACKGKITERNGERSFLIDKVKKL
jgi:DNA polymerase-3 subunit alpha